ncbi:hypothetical protein CTI12_AA471170 [Artemisia annua]|uniref:Uncharacterized protein n=1 Tax=Artemisia annua TaxID=35608 RepID=A0A2U1LNT9_ARTAN|nr:hypothetical protein CTI12_AA471170 [Artemisia annua]
MKKYTNPYDLTLSSSRSHTRSRNTDIPESSTNRVGTDDANVSTDGPNVNSQGSPATPIAQDDPFDIFGGDTDGDKAKKRKEKEMDLKIIDTADDQLEKKLKDLMGPPRKSRSVKKRYSYDNEIFSAKDGDNTNKRKKVNMLGPHWSREELERFYAAYREHETDWRKVAAVLRNRSVEMVEAVYSLNKAYLSLPEGTASVVGFIAMMTDYYSNMEERDSEQERNDGVGTSRKSKKCVPRKVQKSTSKGSVDCFGLHPDAVPSDYGCLPLLKKKRSGGSRPRVVGKRTPRFPVSHSHENVKGEYFPPTSKGLKLKLDNEEGDASERGGSPNRKFNSLMSSPSQSAERMYDEDVASGRFVDNDDDIEGSMEADNTDLSRDKSKERTNAGYMLHNRKGSEGRIVRLDKKENKHLDYIREDCSGTEGQYLGTLRRNFDVDVADVNPSRPSSQVSKKRSKEAVARRDERPTFDALETLASLSLMDLPDSNEKEKDELVDVQVMPAIREGEESKSVYLRETKESHQLITKVSRKRQKIVAPKISNEPHIDRTPKESLEAEATHGIRMSMSRHISQSSSPELVKPGQYVSSGIYSSRKVRSKRKMYKPEAFEISKFSDAVGTDKSGVHVPSFSHRTVKPKVKLSSCLSNQLMRRWCAYEWFYSVIDDPWFSKREFAEYLYHVGLGHVPRLTRVEWGVIRSSLGKPRRFSVQFLKEEQHKLNQYRDSVRTHYTEFRSRSRDGLPTDLARPLLVGQRVIAIYPRTREIHDGTILTIDHDRCRVQFDQPELGAEIIMDTDCMPLNPFENLPASLMRLTPSDKFFESLNDIKVNWMVKDQRLEGYTNCSSREKFQKMDEIASVKSDSQSRKAPRDFKSNYAAHSVPGTLTHIQAKEADIEAIAELTCALDKKVSSALFRLRQRNTYQQNFLLKWPRVVGESNDHGVISSSKDHTANHTKESECHVNEIVEISRTKARSMVDMAIQALPSLRLNPTVDIDKAVDYVSEKIPSNDSYIPPARSNPIASNPVHAGLSLHKLLVSTVKATYSKPISPLDINKSSVPSELITQCVATLFVIQKCTERQVPPAEVASILDSAVSSLQPCSPQNLQVYADIQKCMGIIKNQILALVPT